MTIDWLVGFYEGEGSPGRSGGKYKGKYYNYLRIQIGQKDKSPLLKIRSFLLASGYKRVYIYPNRKTYKGRPYLSWLLYVSGSDAIKFANRVLPRMQSTAKKKQLQNALKGRFHRA